jgi:hypothetical protein
MPAFTRRQYAGGAASTTLVAAINTTDTSCVITANTGWPSTASVPFYCVIDPGTSAEEKVSATISGTTLTLTRGQDDTVASSHAIGAVIYPVFTANDADEANEVAAKLTTKGDILTTDGSALNRLAVGTNDYALLADSAATNGVSWKQIPAAGLASDSVTTAKILNSNVTTAKIADANVTTAKLADKSVTSEKLGSLTVTIQSSAYTFVLSDAERVILFNGGSAATFTIPLNSSVNFPVGTQINVIQYGANQVTFAGASGVTLVSAGTKFKTKETWAIVTLIQMLTNVWILVGNTAA